MPDPSQPALHLEWRSVATLIDHTLLPPETTRAQIEQHCREAARYGFSAVAVQPYWVPVCAAILHSTPVKVCAAIAFPHGATSTAAKRFEATEALRLGADELDMVINLGALKSGDLACVENDIRGVAEIAHNARAIVKVILETSLLTDQEKVTCCELSVRARADFVKTSTGFSSGGATVEDVALMRRTVGNRAGVKASGGIRTAADVAAMLRAGADRIGTSASVSILKELGAPA